MSTFLWIASAIVTLVVVIILGISYKNTRDLLFNPLEKRQQRYADDTEKHPQHKFSQLDLEPAQVELQAQDGVNINAWYIPSSPESYNRRSVILIHGYKMDSGEMAPIAQILVRHGFGVILPDLRAHGDSEGELITFGANEWRDIQAAVDYVARHEPGVTLGIMGNSMGGALSICYAARDKRIRAVVAQSPYASMRHSLSQGIKYFTGLPAFPFVPLMRLFSLPYVDLDAADISPIAMLTQIQDVPVLIMMGGADEVVNPDGAQQLYEAGGEKTHLWYEPELDHVTFHTDMAPEFERRVVEYFNTALQPADSN